MLYPSLNTEQKDQSKEDHSFEESLDTIQIEPVLLQYIWLSYNHIIVFAILLVEKWIEESSFGWKRRKKGMLFFYMFYVYSREEEEKGGMILRQLLIH